ncbi:hypothetical protein SESBI_42485 [Sesbania bispinosa]|nr:hypothetical protein SESBI_42485 [Sesbania bispinosa]
MGCSSSTVAPPLSSSWFFARTKQICASTTVTPWSRDSALAKSVAHGDGGKSMVRSGE